MKQFKLLLKSRWFVWGSVTFILFVLVGIIYPIIGSSDPFLRKGCPFEPPSSTHWLGTNSEGQDMFARLLYGLRASLFVGVAAGTSATAE